MLRQNQSKQATIQRPARPQGFPFLLACALFALCCINSLQAYAQGRTGTQSRKEVQHPLAAPLAKDDPRAQLSAELKNALPLPAAAQVNPNTQAEDAAQGPTVVEFDMQTRKETRSQGQTLAEGMQNELGAVPVNGFRGIAAQAEQGHKESTQAKTNGVDQAESCADRWQTVSSWSYPASAATKVYATFPNGYTYFIGTGTMIGSKYMLTAIDNLYYASLGGWATRVFIAPGESSGYAPYGYAYSTVLRLYSDGYSRVALITLDRHIGYSTGWYGYGTFYDHYLDSRSGHSRGYRFDYPWVQFYNYGDVSYINRDWLSVGVTFHDGLRGSGLYLIDYYGDRYVFGVTQGNWYCGSWGSRLTSWVFGQMRYVISYGL